MRPAPDAKTAMGCPVCPPWAGASTARGPTLPGPVITSGASSPRRATRTLRRWAFPHRPDFDGAHAGHGPSCGDGDGLVAIRDIDEHVPTELLACFGKRTVGHEPFAVAHPDAGRRRRRVQRGATPILPARRELVRELQLLPVDLLSCGQAQLVPGLAQVNQQQVLHKCPSMPFQGEAGDRAYATGYVQKLYCSKVQYTSFLQRRFLSNPYRSISRGL